MLSFAKSHKITMVCTPTGVWVNRITKTNINKLQCMGIDLAAVKNAVFVEKPFHWMSPALIDCLIMSCCKGQYYTSIFVWLTSTVGTWGQKLQAVSNKTPTVKPVGKAHWRILATSHAKQEQAEHGWALRATSKELTSTVTMVLQAEPNW
jgi:hypothetical protein